MRSLIALLGLAAVLSLVTPVQSRADNPHEAPAKKELDGGAERIWQHVTDTYVSPLPAEWNSQKTRFNGKLKSGGHLRSSCAVMLAGVGDRRLRVLDQQQVVQWRCRLDSGYVGIGVKFNPIKRLLAIDPNDPDAESEQRWTFLVEEVVPGGPADQAGVQVGDKLVKINGHDTENGSPDWIMNQATAGDGPIGSDVSLTLSRSTAPTFTVDLKRSVVEVPSKAMQVEMVEEGGRQIQHLKVLNLDYRGLPRLLHEHLVGLKNDTILDLRGTQGDDPELAAILAARFITKGELLRFSERKGERTTTVSYVCRAFDGVTNGVYRVVNDDAGVMVARIVKPVDSAKLVVLVDKHTSAAAEAVAYSLQRAKAGTIVGGVTAGANRLVVTSDLSVDGVSTEIRVQVPGLMLLGQDGKPLPAVRPDTFAQADVAESTAQLLLSGRSAGAVPVLRIAIVVLAVFVFGASFTWRETSPTLKVVVRAALAIVVVAVVVWPQQVGSASRTDEQAEAAEAIKTILRTDEDARADRLRFAHIQRGPLDEPIDGRNSSGPNLVRDAEIEAACRMVDAFTKGDAARLREIVNSYKGKPYARAQLGRALEYAFSKADVPYRFMTHDRYFFVQPDDFEDGSNWIRFSALAEDEPDVGLMLPNGNDGRSFSGDRTDVVSYNEVMRLFQMNILNAIHGPK